MFDVMYVFPIFSISFLCHFNVLPMHCDLIEPSRARIKRVVHSTVRLNNHSNHLRYYDMSNSDMSNNDMSNAREMDFGD